ncbi:hypothetical protein CVD28_00740 [Bacillus sp. M6-12]|uniref:hypothetical protein n=1 Tax=Bacillus sp. M6-12 TaxID=2054166 RepID=UPI000C7876C2|nr:hypothetical protein [Bacillus sp. M6-12]PLS18960.1 hypothetical protein CVD28_00740 [Bacillus sp. M6-12]
MSKTEIQETGWTKELRMWDTLFELKQDDPNFGFEGTIFFATDFAKDVSTGDFKTVIAYTSFNGMNLGKGICSFIVTSEILEEKFQPIETSFREYEKIIEKEYWEERRKEEQQEEDTSLPTSLVDKNGEALYLNDKWAFQGEVFVLEKVNQEYWFIPEKNKDNELEWVDPIISNQGVKIKEEAPTGEM